MVMKGHVPHLSGVQEEVGTETVGTTTLGLTTTTGGRMLLISPAVVTAAAANNDWMNVYIITINIYAPKC